MTKAKKAPQKKPQKRDIKWANIIFLAIGVFVVLSLIITSVITTTATPIVVTPTPLPAVSTPVP
jgi:hypothetical protein